MGTAAVHGSRIASNSCHVLARVTFMAIDAHCATRVADPRPLVNQVPARFEPRLS